MGHVRFQNWRDLPIESKKGEVSEASEANERRKKKYFLHKLKRGIADINHNTKILSLDGYLRIAEPFREVPL